MSASGTPVHIPNRTKGEETVHILVHITALVEQFYVFEGMIDHEEIEEGATKRIEIPIVLPEILFRKSEIL